MKSIKSPDPTNNQKTLLAVFAHPDDETFGTGGTLAYYASIGVKVHLICATRGEAGEVEQRLINNSLSIGEYRENELRCAADKLGICNIHFLDYRDSGMRGSPDNHHPNALISAPIDEVANKILEIVLRIKPQVIITFDPIGGYNHPDHIVIHNATVKAFEMAKSSLIKNVKNIDTPHKLYFNTIQRDFLRLAVRAMTIFGQDPRRFGKNKDIDLLSISKVEYPIHAKIDYRSVIKNREEASECYISQGGNQMNHGILAFWRRLFSSYDTFMRFYPPPVDHAIERDLFEGLDEKKYRTSCT